MGETTGSLVAVGASAGGVDALVELAASLPEDLGAPVLVVLHVPPTSESRLPEILSRAGRLPAQRALDGERPEPNRIYVAPPDRHLLVGDGRLRVVRGPPENRHRPAIDPLFRSAALCYRERAIAVILTGSLDDGAAGARAVEELGGAVIVQDPEEAIFPEMPRSVIRVDSPEAVLPLAQIAAELVRLVGEPRPPNGRREPRTPLRLEVAYAAMDDGALNRSQAFPDRSPFGCPSCGGVLTEAPEPVLRFRCRTGHAFGSDSLLSEQRAQIEHSLMSALRALEERAHLGRRVAERLRATGSADRAARYDLVVDETERDARVIRELLMGEGEADG